MHIGTDGAVDAGRRLCSKCGTRKPDHEFYFRETEGRYNAWCKACTCQFQIRRWKDRKRKAVELLGGKCCRCGYAKNLSAFQFHHVERDQKEFNWNKLRLRSWRRIVEELKKCALVCANCHAEIHSPEDDLIAPEGCGNRRLDQVGPVMTGVCVCGEPVYGTKYCSVACAGIGQRRVKRPTGEELKSLLAKVTRATVARRFGISEATVRKWEKLYGIKYGRARPRKRDPHGLVGPTSFPPDLLGSR